MDVGDATISGAARTSATIAFDKIFMAHHASTVRVIYRLVGNAERAEELASDLFLKLYRSPLPPSTAHNIGAWLYRSAVRLGLDELRASARRRRREEAAPGVLAGEGPLDQLLRDEQARKVRTTLAALRRKHAELLTLHAGDLSYREIAEVMSLNPASVGTLLSRAKQAFEREYRTRYGEESRDERR